MRIWIGLIPVFFISLKCHAFNAYKCKDENGNTVFSQTLCPNTKSEFIQVDPAAGAMAPVNKGKSLTQRLNSAAETKARQNNPVRSSSQVRMSSSLKEKNRNKAMNKNTRLCSQYRDEVSETGIRMRSGYSASDGEMLRVKLKAAKKKVKQYCN